jgi:hypothetical protein
MRPDPTIVATSGGLSGSAEQVTLASVFVDWAADALRTRSGDTNRRGVLNRTNSLFIELPFVAESKEMHGTRRSDLTLLDVDGACSRVPGPRPRRAENSTAGVGMP